MDAESLETVAGVARLLRRATEQAWMQADAAGPRSPSVWRINSSKSTVDPLDKSMSATAGRKADS